jgi:hypothetical protein
VGIIGGFGCIIDNNKIDFVSVNQEVRQNWGYLSESTQFWSLGQVTLMSLHSSFVEIVQFALVTS